MLGLNECSVERMIAMFGNQLDSIAGNHALKTRIKCEGRFQTVILASDQ